MINKIFKLLKKFNLKIKTIYINLFSYNVLKFKKSAKNEYWQTRRTNYQHIKPNDFQIIRAKLFSKFIDSSDKLLFDIGSGDGSQLIAIKEICPEIKIIGSDKDKFACKLMKNNDFKCHLLENNDYIFELIEKYKPSCITIFEVLEHMEIPEELLIKLLIFENIKIFASIPNSGYFMHRIRYIFGRFPLQWIAYPNEHLRFWTLKDLNWWLNYLDIKEKSIIIPYAGIPLLNNIFPNLFAKGSFFIIQKSK